MAYYLSAAGRHLTIKKQKIITDEKACPCSVQCNAPLL